MAGSCTPLLLQQADINFTWSAACKLVNIAQLVVAPIQDDSRLSEDCPLALTGYLTDLISQCNGKLSPPKASVKGLAKEPDIEESLHNHLAEEVRKHLAKPDHPSPVNRSDRKYQY